MDDTPIGLHHLEVRAAQAEIVTWQEREALRLENGLALAPAGGVKDASVEVLYRPAEDSAGHEGLRRLLHSRGIRQTGARTIRRCAGVEVKKVRWARPESVDRECESSGGGGLSARGEGGQLPCLLGRRQAEIADRT